MPRELRNEYWHNFHLEDIKLSKEKLFSILSRGPSQLQGENSLQMLHDFKNAPKRTGNVCPSLDQMMRLDKASQSKEHVEVNVQLGHLFDEI